MIKPEDNIVVVTTDDATAAEVSQAFSSSEPLAVLVRREKIADLVRFLEQRPIGAVMVDIDPMPAAMLTELTPIVARFTRTCFVILSSKWDERLVLDAMAIGARHFMRKASIGSELVQVIQRLSSTGDEAPWVQGTVVTVLSAGGGCGATTLAVNIANELRIAKNKPVLLIDMDVAYGAVATYLNVSGQYGLADVIANGNVVDGDLIASSTVSCDSGLHVLMSPASVNFSDSRNFDYDKMSSVLDACRRVYAFTVVDAPRVSPNVAASLAAASNAILTVLQMSIKDIRVARKIRESLLENGIPSEHVSLVINRYRKKGTSVTLEEVQRAVSSNNIQLVGNDFHPAERSIDLGEPLAKAAPMSALRKDVQKLLTPMILKPGVAFEERV